MQQRQRDRGCQRPVARGDAVLPLLVGLDLDRTARHPHRVPADRVRRRDRRGLRREELHVAGGFADELGQLSQHGRGIARHRVVLHDLDRAAPPDGLDHEVARPSSTVEKVTPNRGITRVVAIRRERGIASTSTRPRADHG